MRFPCGGKGGPASCAVDYAKEWCAPPPRPRLAQHSQSACSHASLEGRVWGVRGLVISGFPCPHTPLLRHRRETDCTDPRYNFGPTGDELDFTRSIMGVPVVGLEDDFK